MSGESAIGALIIWIILIILASITVNIFLWIAVIFFPVLILAMCEGGAL